MIQQIDKYEAKKFLEAFFPQYKITDDPFEKYLGYFEDELIAIITYSIIYERAEINYICVRNEFRRKKIGSKLMRCSLEKIKEQGCLSISLEVAFDNIGAINLYENFGFKKVSTRKKYYGEKDALLFIRELGD